MLDFWEQNLYSTVLHTLPAIMLNTKQLLNYCCISPLMGNVNQEVKHSICQMLVWTKYLLCSRSHGTSILPAVSGCDILLNIQSFKLINLTVFGEVLSHLSFFLIPAFTQTSLPDVCKEPVSLLIKTVFYDESVITELYLCKTLIIQISFVYVSAKH